MSFSATTDQVLARTKTVTRRLNWESVREGQVLRAVNKTMGLKPWTPRISLALIKVTDVRVEPLMAITDADVAAEGFPHLNAAEFVEFYSTKYKVRPEAPVRRIAFEYLDDSPDFVGFKVARHGVSFQATLTPAALRAILSDLNRGLRIVVETIDGTRLEVPAL